MNEARAYLEPDEFTNVFPTSFVEGDYFAIEQAMMACGLPFDGTHVAPYSNSDWRNA